MYQQQKQTKNSESRLKPGSILLKLMQKLDQKKKIYTDDSQIWYSAMNMIFSAEVGCIF